MARPQPKILLEYEDGKYKTQQVLESNGYYAVCYKGEPINLRLVYHLDLFKYKNCAFSNAGHCFNLAEKLNAMFDTTDFTVVQLVVGKVVTEE